MEHKIEASEFDASGMKIAIAESIEKAASLLNKNIRDESCFFLFQWCRENAELKIVVTDERKESDSPDVVICSFVALKDKLKAMQLKGQAEWQRQCELYAEEVKDLARDYLTTCSEYMRYSLVAAFYTNNRQSSTLL